MSIIYDALKKTEEAHNRALEPKIIKPANFKFKTYLVYIVAVCIGFFIANTLFNFFITPFKNNINVTTKNMPRYDIANQEKSQKEMPLLETTVFKHINEAEPKKTTLPPPLVLNGVFFSQNEGYALINNQIVKEGDKVEGAAVVRISLNKVVLEFEGSLIKLSAHNN